MRARVEARARTVLKGLEGSFHFDRLLIEKICCKDGVDREILQVLYEVVPVGIFPRGIGKRLRRFRLDGFEVTRKIESMNKRLKKDVGQTAAKKRGRKTALTDFAYEIWGETEQDRLQEYVP